MRRLLNLGMLVGTVFLVLACSKDGELRIRNRTDANLYVSVDNSEPYHLEAWSNWSKFYSDERTIVIAYNGDYVFANSVTREIRPSLLTTYDIPPDGGAIQIENDSDVSLLEMYISPSGDPNWGLDNLAGVVLPDESALWTVLEGSWDIKLVDANYATYYKYSQEVTTNETLSLLFTGFGKDENRKRQDSNSALISKTIVSPDK